MDGHFAAFGGDSAVGECRDAGVTEVAGSHLAQGDGLVGVGGEAGGLAFRHLAQGSAGFGGGGVAAAADDRAVLGGGAVRTAWRPGREPTRSVMKSKRVSAPARKTVARRLLVPVVPVVPVAQQLFAEIDAEGRRGPGGAESARTVREVIGLADVHHKPGEQGSVPSSGSFRTDGMAVVPCSVKQRENPRRDPHRLRRQPHS
ncbi:hypothetical protein ACF09H_23885 [Streptomyces sp. NPDC014983]|uniref:hypothetical protein n=1 Tax=Streptomyces sp. NPDC014983 TaxID=3364933 RepID=UPI0036F5B419